MDLMQAIFTANALGINLTAADEGTELYECWRDRVELAALHLGDGNLDRDQEMIDAANEYAI